MTSHQRMLALMTQVGIYDVKENSPIWRELKQYGGYFDAWHNALTQMLDDAFLDTVSNAGFAAYEKLFSLPVEMFVAVAKPIIKTRLAITNDDFTASGVKRCLMAGGIEAAFVENFTANTITVTVLSDKQMYGSIDLRNEFIRSCIPCHAEVIIA